MVNKLFFYVVSGAVILAIIAFADTSNLLIRTVVLGYILALIAPAVTLFKKWRYKNAKREPGIYPDGVVGNDGKVTHRPDLGLNEQQPF